VSHRRAKSEKERPLCVARNIVDNHGAAQYAYLLDALQHNVPGPEIAARMGVSRERIRQWKNVLGTELRIYQPCAAALSVLPRALR